MKTKLNINTHEGEQVGNVKCLSHARFFLENQKSLIQISAYKSESDYTPLSPDHTQTHIQISIPIIF